MGQKENIMEQARNGMKITKEKGSRNGASEMIEKAQDKTREVVRGFFSDEARKEYLSKKGRKEKTFEKHEKRIRDELEKKGVDLRDEDLVKEFIIISLKRTPAIKKAVENNLKGAIKNNTGKEPNSDAKKNNDVKKEKQKEKTKKRLEIFNRKIGDSKEKGDFQEEFLFKCGEKYLKVFLLKRTDEHNNAYVGFVDEKGGILKLNKRKEFRLGEARKALTEAGFSLVSEKADSKKEKSGDFPNVAEFFDVENSGYHKRSEAGAYVRRKDGLKMEIVYYYPQRGIVKVVLSEGQEMKKISENRDKKSGITIPSFEMPKRTKEDGIRVEEMGLKKFKDFIRDYEYKPEEELIEEEKYADLKTDKVRRQENGEGGKGEDVEAVIKNVMSAGEDGDLPMEAVLHQKELDKKEKEENKAKAKNSFKKIGDDGMELPSEKNKDAEEYKKGLGEVVEKPEKERANSNTKEQKKEIKTREQFEEEFYPVGTKLESEEGFFFMEILDTRINDEGSLEIKLKGGQKRKSKKDNYQTQTSWLDLNSFKKIYEKEDIIWEVIENSKKQEEKVKFTEEEKKYIEEKVKPFFVDVMKQTDKWVEACRKEGLQEATLKAMRSDYKDTVLKDMSKKLKKISFKSGLLEGKISILIEELE